MGQREGRKEQVKAKHRQHKEGRHGERRHSKKRHWDRRRKIRRRTPRRRQEREHGARRRARVRERTNIVTETAWNKNMHGVVALATRRVCEHVRACVVCAVRCVCCVRCSVVLLSWLYGGIWCGPLVFLCATPVHVLEKRFASGKTRHKTSMTRMPTKIKNCRFPKQCLCRVGVPICVKWPPPGLIPLTVGHVLHDFHRSNGARKHKQVVELSRSGAFAGPHHCCQYRHLVDASSISMPAPMAPQHAMNWNRKFRTLPCPSKPVGFPTHVMSSARASFCLASNCAARVSAVRAAASAWCTCRSRSEIRCCSSTAPETTTQSEKSTNVHGAQRWRSELCVMDTQCVLA